MKTWTEWIGVSEPNDNLSLPINKQQYEAILMDGIRHGMTRAAKIVIDPEEMQPITQSEINTGKACECAIIDARDKLKELPK